MLLSNIANVGDNLFIVTIDKQMTDGVEDCNRFELKAVCSKEMLFNELDKFCFSDDDKNIVETLIENAKANPAKLQSH